MTILTLSVTGSLLDRAGHSITKEVVPKPLSTGDRPPPPHPEMPAATDAVRMRKKSPLSLLIKAESACISAVLSEYSIKSCERQRIERAGAGGCLVRLPASPALFPVASPTKWCNQYREKANSIARMHQ